MVVFGAGASYDSSPDYPPTEQDVHSSIEGGGFYLRGVRPPLANQLFELRPIFASAAQKIPKCRLILGQLRDMSSDMSVEQELERLRERSLNYPEGRRQLLSIQFYLQWTIGECQSEWNRRTYSHTTYQGLLGQIDRRLKGEQVCLVTFNYDTLIEEAFVSLGKGFRSLDDYISKDDYKIIKPHGSVNWARELTEPKEADKLDHLQMANDLIAQAETLQASNKYHQIPDSDRSPNGQWIVSHMLIPGKPGHQAVLPAIAIPLEKKTEYECPPGHVQALEQCISKTDKLLIIGWKAAEEHFVKLLAKGLSKEIPKMIVSSGRDSAGRIKDTLQSFGVDGAGWLFGESGFTDAVRSGRIENFISR